VCERRNQTYQNMIHNMMSHAYLPENLCGECLRYSVYILNRVPFESVVEVPYKPWIGKNPSLNHLHVWGCPAEAKLFNPSITKLDLRTVSCFFVGFPERSKGYEFYCPSRPIEIVECARAHFIEDGSISHRDIKFEEVSDDITSVTPIDVSIFSAPSNASVDQNPDPMPNVDENLHVVPPPIIAPPRRSVRERRSVIPDDYVTYFVEGESDLTDPVSYHQAMNIIFVVQWREAMEDELKFSVGAKTLA